MRIHKLLVSHENKEYPIYLGTSSLNYNALYKERKKFLSNSELDIFGQLKFEKKKKSFLQSRYLAKNILAKYLGEEDFRKISISHGIFSHPLVNYPTGKMPIISISHTKTHAACIVSSAKCPTGVDIEAITTNSKENIISQTTTHERNNLKNVENENSFYTRIWTIKEALSKVLKTGIMTPFNIYEINNIVYYKNYTISRFSNFNQYQAISFAYKKNILSFITPSSMIHTHLDENIFSISHSNNR